MLKKNCVYIAIASLLCFTLCSCGKVQSAQSLIKQAERNHGKCIVISKTETAERTEVVLKDVLQGFEYTVSSYMSNISIDGSSFGSLPYSNDGFSNGLHSYIATKTRESCTDICKKRGIVYTDYNEIQIGPSVSEEDGIKTVEEIAALLQEYNLEHRLDKYVINLSHDGEWLHTYYERLKNGHDKDDIYSDPEYSFQLSSAGGSIICHIGSVRLPDITFRDKDKESEDYYLEMAQMKNRESVFLRREEKTFADTGISLDRVTATYDQYYPKQMSDPVTFYYFSANGKEFYICNFLDNELQTLTWYSNYKEVFFEKKR